MQQAIVRFFSAALLTAAFFSVSCVKEDASDVNQDKIYTEYELFYDKNTDKTIALARFKFGGITGTLLELDSTSEVTFNGDKLAYNAFFGAHVKDYSGLVSGGKFVYKNLKDEVFENTVPAFESIEFPAIDTIRKNAAYTLSWTGTALKPDQEVGLAINGINQADAQLFATDLDGATSLILPLNKLQALGTGKATCVMDRWTILKTIDGTPEGGTIVGKYRAKNIQPFIKD